MSDDLRARADARLERALETAAIRDPRPLLRPVLRQLKERDDAAFRSALHHYDNVLLPAVAGTGDAVSEWRAYARLLATLAGAGRTVAVDGSGRAATVSADAAPESALLLHLPDDGAAPTVVLHCPRDPTPAQEASLELLVHGRVSASLYG